MLSSRARTEGFSLGGSGSRIWQTPVLSRWCRSMMSKKCAYIGSRKHFVYSLGRSAALEAELVVPDEIAGIGLVNVNRTPPGTDGTKCITVVISSAGAGKLLKNEDGTDGNPLQPVRSPMRENWPPPPRLKHWPARNPLQKPLPSVPVHSWVLARRATGALWTATGERHKDARKGNAIDANNMIRRNGGRGRKKKRVCEKQNGYSERSVSAFIRA
ncbi:hypothetical protein B0H19DRAFT_1150221 [Mycena capillaripes]|nr:hypothetical protein B0H19DRAFT_1150221 [Mycena capillaripes]